MSISSVKGFTLIEALIAVLILTIGIFAVMLGFPRGLQSLEDSEVLTQHSFYLFSTLERVKAICEANAGNAEHIDFQAQIGKHPIDPWGNPDPGFDSIFFNRTDDRTVDIIIRNNDNNVQLFGSIAY